MPKRGATEVDKALEEIRAGTQLGQNFTTRDAVPNHLMVVATGRKRIMNRAGFPGDSVT